MCVQDNTQMVYSLTTLVLLIVISVWYWGRKRFQDGLREESGEASPEWKQDRKIRRLSRVKTQLSKEKVKGRVKRGKKPRK